MQKVEENGGADAVTPSALARQSVQRPVPPYARM
jgi:hypothetical protein